jgi:preprotein translocase subunit SecF
VPLENIASFSQGPGVNAIRHVDRRRVVRVTAQNEDRSAVEIAKELRAKLEKVALPPGYSFDFSGEYQETEESFASLKLAYLIAFILIFTLLVTQFNSYFQPFAIMTALPLSVVGAMIGLLVTGNNFSIMSFVGLVGLTGIVVNDSIVLVDCINRMRQEGRPIFEAIVAAGQQRLRPIISTTVTTMGGIVTLTITDKLWEGLGVVIIFGIGFATVLTLIVVPVMYSLFEGLGYQVSSALRGPRWTDPPEGRSFFFSRRRGVLFWLFVIVLFQIAVMAAGIYKLSPLLIEELGSVVLQAPTPLKLVIETVVFGLGIGLRVIGVLLALLLPTWAGLLFLMSRRSAEERYVDVTPAGLNITTPVEKLFIPAAAITSLSYCRLINRLTITTGRRKVKISRVVEARKTPLKTPLWTWLVRKPPRRAELGEGMAALREGITGLLEGKSSGASDEGRTNQPYLSATSRS